MTASMLLRGPVDRESSLAVEEVMDELQRAGVVFGIDHAAIEKAIQERRYNTPIYVASGTKPQRGDNARFEYHFATHANLKPKEDEYGHIDYRDINFIQNTEKDALLVTKIPATPGKPGMSVHGKEIASLPGRDLQFNYGTNTRISDDETQLIAAASGVIQFKNNKVSVSDVIVISGDVDHSVGNIDCRGSVHVRGHVRAGFTLKIDGDLEVDGNVEDSDISVDGNIYVKGGFFGEGTGKMRAAGDITVKYAEGQRLLAGSNVEIGAEMINCTVTAGGRVWVKGRRGKIVGGQIRAGKGIRAAILGADAGTRTQLMAGYDHKTMTRYVEVVKELGRLEEDGERVKEGLYGLYRAQMDGELSPDKKAAMAKLEAFREQLPESLGKLNEEKAELEKVMLKMKGASIVGDNTIYPGVKASFGIIYLDIVDEMRHTELTLEAGKVHASKFKPD